jgi:acyl-CoA synthetase (AMP-forming)/AMP-acid ligase II
MTETNGIGTSLRGNDSCLYPDSVGRATATVQVEVRDAATRRPVADGEIGEIALRSAATFVGYWRNPEATAKALDEARWYHTGDYGYIQDGRLYLAGRRQDLIIRGGENIYPAEVENRLFEHPDVDEVAVVGVEHAMLGQEVWAYVVRVAGGTLAEDEAMAWCSQVLAGFKVPSRVVFVDSLPHNASGKILRHLIGKDQSGSGFVEE